MKRRHLLWLCLVAVGCTLRPRAPGPPTRAEAPSFELPSHRGERVSLSSLIDDGPAVLVFYRGFW